ncbi:hypothetical protein B0J13DRAFT_181309 [Dactylonectria estremocensis]|uniref:CID domain-containing protein n=1 Tax=Dactylonectria estremocensis TaxID=1079267 RepID=A0A9P9FBS8_9HYPO|nr:hypothetical protein B0J13DRAFT_181309 [Dactylonectria estremocensis]
MSSGKGFSGFPDLEAKLQKPTKQSAFERQKAEAEAKRQREAAETAAVYSEFVKSFDDDDDRRDGFGNRGRPGPPRPRGGGFGGPPAGAGTGRRHFGTSGLKSGPGSLGTPPPSSSFGKKRSFQDFARAPREKNGPYQEDSGGPLSVPRAFHSSDDEDQGDRAEEKAVPKPTLRLSNLPPGTSPAMIKALIPDNLTVENAKLVPPGGPTNNSERRCTVSIVTLSQDTPANEIDAAVGALQNRYLGYGYYLSLHRHLSSAVSSSAALPNLASSSSSSSYPFGAKPVEQPSVPNHQSTQQGFHRGFAPPSSYAPPGAAVSRANLLHVPVKPPQDVRTIQLISKVIEGVLEQGPEFEALLMTRPEVQREEKWAWIWDARSLGGIWYRWRLWEVVTGSQLTQKKGKYVPLFDGSHAWKAPEKNLSFEYTTRLDEFVSDSEYNSSDDEDFEEDGKRDAQDGEVEKTFLNPLEKAKLTHLLARLPTTLSRLRKGDIARVTAFAITHASRGVDEVVDTIVSNVANPFALTGANPDKKLEPKEPQQSTGQDESTTSEGTDVSAASLVGLYVVNDILSSSATSGVRHAWRFRQLFETSLKDRKIFETLGLMAERLKWGRLRAEKWKRSVNLVLNLWEGWCVFPNESHELFVQSFENPPSSNAGDKVENEENKGKWKAVDASQKGEGEPVGLSERMLPVSVKDADVPGEPTDDDDIAGEPVGDEDVEGEPIEDDDIEGEPIEEDDVEGESIEQDDIEGQPMDQDEAVGNASPTQRPSYREQIPSIEQTTEPSRAGGPPRKRIRAVDMFADSDDSDKAS